jgi:hypothetical protein
VALTDPFMVVTRSVHTEARGDEGIRIEFIPSVGEPSVSAIMVRRLP